MATVGAGVAGGVAIGSACARGMVGSPFLDYAFVAADNNFGERQILPVVILRKNSQSHRSDRGAATQAVLTSIYRTLRLRGLNPTKAIADALKTHLIIGRLSALPGVIASSVPSSTAGRLAESSKPACAMRPPSGDALLSLRNLARMVNTAE